MAAAVVITMALEEHEQELPVLYVKSSADPAQMTVVPYFPEMQLFEYLRTVLGPRAGRGGVSADGLTVCDTFVSEANAVVFNRSNRLLRLGDVVAPDAVLRHTGEAGARGNATRADIVEPCAICLERDTDFELPSCHHRFHAACIADCAKRLRAGQAVPCPLCRAPL